MEIPWAGVHSSLLVVDCHPSWVPTKVAICFMEVAVAQKTGTCPGKWKNGPKPAVCPSDRSILSHTQISARLLGRRSPQSEIAGLPDF